MISLPRSLLDGNPLLLEASPRRLCAVQPGCYADEPRLISISGVCGQCSHNHRRAVRADCDFGLPHLLAMPRGNQTCPQQRRPATTCGRRDNISQENVQKAHLTKPTATVPDSSFSATALLLRTETSGRFGIASSPSFSLPNRPDASS